MKSSLLLLIVFFLGALVLIELMTLICRLAIHKFGCSLIRSRRNRNRIVTAITAYSENDRKTPRFRDVFKISDANDVY